MARLKFDRVAQIAKPGQCWSVRWKFGTVLGRSSDVGGTAAGSNNGPALAYSLGTNWSPEDGGISAAAASALAQKGVSSGPVAGSSTVAVAH